MPPRFPPGLDPARALYADAVAPLLPAHLPDASCSAALVGPGSEVLGLDTERSTDHDRGPRLQLFLSGARDRARVRALLADRLPDRGRDPDLRHRPPVGTVDQFADHPDVLTAPEVFRALGGSDLGQGPKT